MRKSDLKNRMVVEIREGLKFLVIGDTLITNYTACSLDNYNGDLTSITGKELDVVKVYELTCFDTGLCEVFDETMLNPIWERREEYTFTEALKAFEEGKEIKSCETRTSFCLKDKTVLIKLDSDPFINLNKECLQFSFKEIKGKWHINN